MGSITIDGLSAGLVQRIQTRAKARGHTLEEAVLDILKGALPGSDEAVPDYPGSAKEVLERIRASYREIGFRDLDEEPPSLTPCCCPCHRES